MAAQPVQRPPLSDVLPDDVHINQVRQWIRDINAGNRPNSWQKGNREYRLVRVVQAGGGAPPPWQEYYELQRVDRDAAGVQQFNAAREADRMQYQIAFQANYNNTAYAYYGYHMAPPHGQGWAYIGMNGGKRKLSKLRKSKTKKGKKSKKSKKTRRSRKH